MYCPSSPRHTSTLKSRPWEPSRFSGQLSCLDKVPSALTTLGETQTQPVTPTFSWLAGVGNWANSRLVRLQIVIVIVQYFTGFRYIALNTHWNLKENEGRTQALKQAAPVSSTLLAQSFVAYSVRLTRWRQGLYLCAQSCKSVRMSNSTQTPIQHPPFLTPPPPWAGKRKHSPPPPHPSLCLIYMLISMQPFGSRPFYCYFTEPYAYRWRKGITCGPLTGYTHKTILPRTSVYTPSTLDILDHRVE